MTGFQGNMTGFKHLTMLQQI